MRVMTLHTRTLGLRTAGASPLADIDQDLVRLRERLEAAIEGAIALLDRLDAPDEEPGGWRRLGALARGSRGARAAVALVPGAGMMTGRADNR